MYGAFWRLPTWVQLLVFWPIGAAVIYMFTQDHVWWFLFLAAAAILMPFVMPLVMRKNDSDEPPRRSCLVEVG